MNECPECGGDLASSRRLNWWFCYDCLGTYYIRGSAPVAPLTRRTKIVRHKIRRIEDVDLLAEIEMPDEQK